MARTSYEDQTVTVKPIQHRKLFQCNETNGYCTDEMRGNWLVSNI